MKKYWNKETKKLMTKDEMEAVVGNKQKEQKEIPDVQEQKEMPNVQEQEEVPMMGMETKKRSRK